MGRFVYSVFSEHYRFIGGKVALFYGMFFFLSVGVLTDRNQYLVGEDTNL
jgi:hypothetical protein